MKRICTIIVLFAACLIQAEGSVRYEVRAALLGKVGDMTVSTKKSVSSYDCRIVVKSRGLAALLSGGRSDIMHARGVRTKRGYYSKGLEIETRKRKKHRSKKYIFDSRKKIVVKRKRSWKNSSLISDRSEKLPYYTSMDPVGLYYAVVEKMAGKIGTKHEYKIAGVEKAGGKIEVIIPDNTAQKVLSKKYKSAGLLMIYMKIRGEVLGKKNRKVLMAVDRKTGTIEKAWLSSMPVVGTVTISRIAEKKLSSSKK